MAGELQASIPALTGRRFRAVLWSAVGQVYNTVTPGFEAWSDGNVANYAITMSEQGASGRWVGNMPAVAAGAYRYEVINPADQSDPIVLVLGDPVVWTGEIQWSGSAPLGLDDVASGADPLLNTVPGTYPSGSAGYSLGRIGSGQITTTSTVAASGDIPEIVGGADYHASDGRAFDWTDTDGTWPDLTGAAVEWEAEGGAGMTATHAMSVVTPSGAGKKVRLQLTAAQTVALQTTHTGVWGFTVWATLSGGRVVPLLRGGAAVRNDPGP